MSTLGYCTSATPCTRLEGRFADQIRPSANGVWRWERKRACLEGNLFSTTFQVIQSKFHNGTEELAVPIRLTGTRTLSDGIHPVHQAMALSCSQDRPFGEGSLHNLYCTDILAVLRPAALVKKGHPNLCVTGVARFPCASI